jgi:hypothetical protein
VLATQRIVVGAKEPRTAQAAATTAMEPMSSAMAVPSHRPSPAPAAAIAAIKSAVRRAVTRLSCH